MYLIFYNIKLLLFSIADFFSQIDKNSVHDLSMVSSQTALASDSSAANSQQR